MKQLSYRCKIGRKQPVTNLQVQRHSEYNCSELMLMNPHAYLPITVPWFILFFILSKTQKCHNMNICPHPTIQATGSFVKRKERKKDASKALYMCHFDCFNTFPNMEILFEFQ